MAIFYLPKARIQIYFDEDPLNWNTNRYSDFFLPPHFCFASRPGNCRGFGSQDGAQSGYVAHRSTEMVNRPVNSRSRSMRAALAGLPTFRSDKKKSVCWVVRYSMQTGLGPYPKKIKKRHDLDLLLHALPKRPAEPTSMPWDQIRLGGDRMLCILGGPHLATNAFLDSSNLEKGNPGLSRSAESPEPLSRILNSEE